MNIVKNIWEGWHMKIKKRYRLKTEILWVVLTAMLIVDFSISIILSNIYRNIFVDTYGSSQKQVFDRIENELNGRHENIARMLEQVTTSWHIPLFFKSLELDDITEFSINYKMQKEINAAIPEAETMNPVLIISSNGKSHTRTQTSVTEEFDTILKMECSTKALESNGNVVYTYLEKGFTADTKNESVIVASKAFNTTDESGEYAIVYMIMKQSVLDDYYSYFTSEMTDFYVVDHDGMIVSTTQKTNIGKQVSNVEKALKKVSLDQVEGRIQSGGKTILFSELPYYQYDIIGVIDNQKALDKLYDVRQIFMVSLLVSVVVSAIIFFLVGRMTKPLVILIKKMEVVTGGNLTEYVEVDGPEEIMRLSDAFNYMIVGLNRYVEELVAIQNEKRKAEMKALQMQIKPHYIYNTLAGVKYLIWQGEQEKAVTMIEAFIRLLRNAVHNEDEYVTIQSEIESVKDYAYINNIRYGEKVKVDFFLAQDCKEEKVPKLILQPFLENTFLHAFPGEREGNVEIIVSTQEHKLSIVIADDGIGMDKRTCENILKEGISDKKNGIGIHNVHARLQLIYGEEYSIHIVSEPDKGTKIVIYLPLSKNEEQKAE